MHLGVVSAVVDESFVSFKPRDFGRKNPWDKNATIMADSPLHNLPSRKLL